MGVTQCCLEALLRGDNKGNIVPWLAESYQVADDLKSITFTLRKGVKFHDGSDFNAEVAKWNLDNYINARLEPYWASVDIIDDYTVRVNFTEWMNTLPVSFGDAGVMEAYMISKAAYDANGKKWVRANPVGTGPFKFESFTLDVNIKFVRNPDYWVEGKPYLDGMEYIFIADPTTQKMTMQTGDADMVFLVNAGKPAADFAAMGLTVQVDMYDANGLVPDTANADSPWANKKVREAAEHAIDREAIAKAFGYGYWQAPYQIPTRASLAYDPDFTLARKYDPEKAKQLLAEAGYPDGFKTSIIPMPLGLNQDLLVAIQAYLAEVGIQAELDIPEIGRWGTYMGAHTSWPKGAALFQSAGIGLNAVGEFQFFFNMFGQNWLRTPELTQAYEAALSSPAPDVKLIRAVTDIISRDALLIPICENGVGSASQPYVMDTGFLERGSTVQWNTEDAWLNK
jgi:ABC-type transport system substrate-binding protein